MKQPVLLYAVCDGGRGRLLIRHPGSKIHEKQFFESLHLLDKSKDLGTDRPGRARESATPTKHAYQPTDLHRLEKQRFSKMIAREINRSFADHEFDQLVLIAPIGPLQAIRYDLSPSVRQVLVQEIQKDLTKTPAHKLEALLTASKASNAKTRSRKPISRKTYLSKRAATPGRVLPSSHSKNAPPAAET